MPRAVHLNGTTHLANYGRLNNLLPSVANAGVLNFWYRGLDPTLSTMFLMMRSNSVIMLRVRFDTFRKMEIRIGSSATNWIELQSITTIPLNGQWHNVCIAFCYNLPRNNPLFVVPFLDGLIHGMVGTDVGVGFTASTMTYPNNRFFVGGEPGPTINSTINGFRGDLAEVWFSPLITAGISPVTFMSGLKNQNDRMVQGAYLVARAFKMIGGSRVVAGNPGYDGAKLILPYAPNSIRPQAPFGAPPIYLRGGTLLFPMNHSSPQSFGGFPEPLSEFFVDNRRGMSSALSEPFFGD